MSVGKVRQPNAVTERASANKEQASGFQYVHNRLVFNRFFFSAVWQFLLAR
jgi:hypothetical protein